jgi:hypothetical protein
MPSTQWRDSSSRLRKWPIGWMLVAGSRGKERTFRMKRIAFLAAGVVVAGLTACTSSAPSAAPVSGPNATSSSAGASSLAATSSSVSANCRQQYNAWKNGRGEGLVAAVSAAGSTAQAGDIQALRAVLKNTRPALTRAARYPMPTCADPKGYWPALLMHVNAAAASTASTATLTAAMKGVPTLVRELNAELQHAGR